MLAVHPASCAFRSTPALGTPTLFCPSVKTLAAPPTVTTGTLTAKGPTTTTCPSLFSPSSPTPMALLGSELVTCLELKLPTTTCTNSTTTTTTTTTTTPARSIGGGASGGCQFPKLWASAVRSELVSSSLTTPTPTPSTTTPSPTSRPKRVTFAPPSTLETHHPTYSSTHYPRTPTSPTPPLTRTDCFELLLIRVLTRIQQDEQRTMGQVITRLDEECRFGREELVLIVRTLRERERSEGIIEGGMGMGIGPAEMRSRAVKALV